MAALVLAPSVGASLVCLTLLAESSFGQERKPYSAVVRRTSRTVYTDGRPPLLEEVREIYHRSSNGSFRRENWKSTSGAPATPPAFVTLFDAPTSRKFRIFDQARRAEWVREPNAKSEGEFEMSAAPGQTVETHHGLPCVVLKSIFLNAQREKMATGKACRALDLGFVIHERMVVPHPRGDATVYWEADLERVEWAEPSASLMRVPPDYAIVEVTQPSMACTNCGRP